MTYDEAMEYLVLCKMDPEVVTAITAEVRRLRDENARVTKRLGMLQSERECYLAQERDNARAGQRNCEAERDQLRAELSQLRAERDAALNAGEAAELRIVELRKILATIDPNWDVTYEALKPEEEP